MRRGEEYCAWRERRLPLFPNHEQTCPIVRSCSPVEHSIAGSATQRMPNKEIRHDYRFNEQLEFLSEWGQVSVGLHHVSCAPWTVGSLRRREEGSEKAFRTRVRYLERKEMWGYREDAIFSHSVSSRQHVRVATFILLDRQLWSERADLFMVFWTSRISAVIFVISLFCFPTHHIKSPS